MATAQYLMNHWTFLSLKPFFLVYKWEVCCISCEEHNIKDGAGCPKLLSSHTAPWLLFSQAQVIINSSIWKDWRQNRLGFVTFYPSDPSNVSPFISSLLLCHNRVNRGRQAGLRDSVFPLQSPCGFLHKSGAMVHLQVPSFPCGALLRMEHCNGICDSLFSISTWPGYGDQLFKH